MLVSVIITNNAALMAKLAIITNPARLLYLNDSKHRLITVKQIANEIPHNKVRMAIIVGTKPPWTPMLDNMAIVHVTSPINEAKTVNSSSSAPARPDKMRAIRMPIELLVLMGLSTFKL